MLRGHLTQDLTPTPDWCDSDSKGDLPRLWPEPFSLTALWSVLFVLWFYLHLIHVSEAYF